MLSRNPNLKGLQETTHETRSENICENFTACPIAKSHKFLLSNLQCEVVVNVKRSFWSSALDRYVNSMQYLGSISFWIIIDHSAEFERNKKDIRKN